MLFRKFLSRFSSIRTFSRTSFRCSKEFHDRHLQNFIDNNEFTSMSAALLRIRTTGHRIYIIQPSMKFKARGRQSTTAELQLAESVALIESLEKWSVVGHGIYTLKSNGSKRYLYGTGNIEKITEEIHQCHATAVFISIDRLSLIQIDSLSEKFSVPVYDRYSIVLQIFKNHAKSGAAKLQVALAEIPLLRYRKNDGELFKDRERQLRAEITKLEQHRKLIKARRSSIDIPTVAVLGYTNAGKTALIKALTKDASLQPKNQLFATLDVTAHAAHLPNALKVLFVDTVGFIADIPTHLIEAFRATLNDAIDAHLLIHVCDISHPDHLTQQRVVLKTLKELNVSDSKLQSMITVFNKIDRLNEDLSRKSSVENENVDDDDDDDDEENIDDDPGEDLQALEESPSQHICYISCKTGEGLDQLIELVQNELMIASDRIVCVYRALQGGELYQILSNGNFCAIEEMNVDEKDAQFIRLKCIFSKVAYEKFRARYKGADKYQLSSSY